MTKIIEVAFKEREYKLSESTTIKLTEFKITGSDAMVFSSKFSDEDCLTVTAR